MGLGKTLQTISLLAYLHENCGFLGSHLIIVPKSVAGNWIKEIKKLCPSIKSIRMMGNKDDRKHITTEELMMPSARELHFAKQCCPRTRERVGFLEEHHKDQNMLRWTIRKKGFTIPKNMEKPRMVELDADSPYEHLRDKKGIPVFYAEGLTKQRGGGIPRVRSRCL